MITRRQFTASTPWLAASPLVLPGCSQEPATDSYEAVAERTWQLGAVSELSGVTLGRELVRYATLAPSSHNTQCWRFAHVDGRRDHDPARPGAPLPGCRPRRPSPVRLAGLRGREPGRRLRARTGSRRRRVSTTRASAAHGAGADSGAGLAAVPGDPAASIHARRIRRSAAPGRRSARARKRSGRRRRAVAPAHGASRRSRRRWNSSCRATARR